MTDEVARKLRWVSLRVWSPTANLCLGLRSWPQPLYLDFRESSLVFQESFRRLLLTADIDGATDSNPKYEDEKTTTSGFHWRSDSPSLSHPSSDSLPFGDCQSHWKDLGRDRLQEKYEGSLFMLHQGQHLWEQRENGVKDTTQHGPIKSYPMEASSVKPP